MNSLYCYIDGEFKKCEKVGVPLSDIGLLRGYALYEGIRAYGGRPFLFKEHFDRLSDGALALGIKVPCTFVELEDIAHTLLKKNKHTEATVRILLTGGDAIDGIKLGTPARLAVMTEEAHPYLEERYTKGVKLITLPHHREMPRAKTTSYLSAVSSQAECARQGALEVLYVYDGRILEAATSNFFLVKKGSIVTAKEGVLLGTTRGLVLDLAKEKYSTEEREVLLRELGEADEAFITGSFKEVMPVVQVNDQVIGNGEPGPITKDLSLILLNYINTETYGKNVD